MDLTPTDRRLLAAIEDGLPLTQHPFAAVGERIGIEEADVLARLDRLSAAGVIARFGVVVRHRELGYRANAMVVWEAPHGIADIAGRKLAVLPYVTLAYRRERRPPEWPYNLFCMIHGRSRETVLKQIEEAGVAAGLADYPRAILFSRRAFKQRGARYAGAQAIDAESAA
jgi:DNA-binding Lrp family transcriptional regulator